MFQKKKSALHCDNCDRVSTGPYPLEAKREQHPLLFGESLANKVVLELSLAAVGRFCQILVTSRD